MNSQRSPHAQAADTGNKAQRQEHPHQKEASPAEEVRQLAQAVAEAQHGILRPPDPLFLLNRTGTIPVPIPLLTQLYHTPIAIGIYAVVGYLFHHTQQPVPLSRGDLLYYDRTLTERGVCTALKVLNNQGWLISAQQRNRRKPLRTPGWGTIRKAPAPWDPALPLYGQPAKLAILMLDSTLIEQGWGVIHPHETKRPLIEPPRLPNLALADLSAYILTILGLPTPTNRLLAAGLIIAGYPQPVRTQALQEEAGALRRSEPARTEIETPEEGR